MVDDFPRGIAREPGSWMSWRALGSVAAVVSGMAAATAAYRLAGYWYAVPALPLAPLFFSLQRRWGLPSYSYVVFSFVWPASLLWSPFIFVFQERARRERIVREVMET